MVEAVAQEVHSTMQDSVAIYNPETRQITVTSGVSGVSLDTERLISTVLDAYSRGDFRRTIFDYDVVLYNPVDLSRYYREYCYPMENAVYDPETKSVTQEVVGFGFDLEAAQQQVIDQLFLGIQLIRLRDLLCFLLQADNCLPYHLHLVVAIGGVIANNGIMKLLDRQPVSFHQQIDPGYAQQRNQCQRPIEDAPQCIERLIDDFRRYGG